MRCGLATMMVAEHPKTTIQVIRAVGSHAGRLGGFIIADLDARPPVAYLETAADGHVTDSPAVAAYVALSFDRLRAEAESRAASRDLIRKAEIAARQSFNYALLDDAETALFGCVYIGRHCRRRPSPPDKGHCPRNFPLALSIEELVPQLISRSRQRWA
jgi:hypothetical protein